MQKSLDSRNYVQAFVEAVCTDFILWIYCVKSTPPTVLKPGQTTPVLESKAYSQNMACETIIKTYG